MFGHTTACRSLALTFSAAIYFAMKCSAPCAAVLSHSLSSWVALTFSAAIYFAMRCSAPCAAVLSHSLSSWVAVFYWSALISKALRLSRKYPIHSSSCPLTQHAPLTSSPNITHVGSLVSSMRATTSKRVQIENREVGAIVLPPTDAASQEPMVGSAQRVVVARARAPRDADILVRLDRLTRNMSLFRSLM